MHLLSRDEFRTRTFQRDHHKCIICEKAAKDAHHILERRLFPDGGYYLDNGASLCEEHHLQAELTTLSCEEIRAQASIQNVVVPPHFRAEWQYDKWGNPILPNQQRAKGELFYTEPVQKTLYAANLLHLFCDYVDYPRTFHLAQSQSDSPLRLSAESFAGQKIAITAKIEGAQASIYGDFAHGRAFEPLELPPYLQERQALLEAGLRLCGRLQAQQFVLHSVWENLSCLSWEETQSYADLLDLPLAPLLYSGLYEEQALPKGQLSYVLRLSDGFELVDFRKSVAQCVFNR